MAREPASAVTINPDDRRLRRQISLRGVRNDIFIPHLIRHAAGHNGIPVHGYGREKTVIPGSAAEHSSSAEGHHLRGPGPAPHTRLPGTLCRLPAKPKTATAARSAPPGSHGARPDQLSPQTQHRSEGQRLDRHRAAVPEPHQPEPRPLDAQNHQFGAALTAMPTSQDWRHNGGYGSFTYAAEITKRDPVAVACRCRIPGSMPGSPGLRRGRLLIARLYCRSPARHRWPGTESAAPGDAPMSVLQLR